MSQNIYSGLQQWEQVQARTFTKWINAQISKRGRKIANVFEDLKSGVNLINLYEVISDTPLKTKWRAEPKTKIHEIDNLSPVITEINKFVSSVGIKVTFSPNQINDGDKRQILGMIWVLIHKFEIQGISEEELSAREGLLLWCKKKTAGYKGVNVQDFSNSFKDGLAFSALIHKHYPKLIDFDSLKKENMKENLELAFNVAEKDLGIPSLLDVDDMINFKPDDKSVMTYVAYYWKKFASSQKTEKAGKQIGKISKKIKENDKIIHDYEERAKKLIKWCEDKNKGFSNTSAEFFGNCLSKVQEKGKEYMKFKNEEKPKENGEKKDLALLLANLNSKQKTEGVSLYKPPKELSTEKIDEKWNNLTKVQKEYEIKLNERIQLMKKLESLFEKFSAGCNQIKEWQKDKNEKTLGFDPKSIDTISAAQAKINNLNAFENEIKKIIEKFEDLKKIGKEIIDNKHLNTADVKKLEKECEDENKNVEEKRKKLKEELENLLKYYQEIEKNQLEFSKNVKQLDLEINDAIVSLMEPVIAQSVKEVEDAQKVNNSCVEKLEKAKSVLETITDLHEKITKSEKDSSVYSPMKYEEIKQKYEKSVEDLNSRKKELEDEMEKQIKNVELLKEWNENCVQYLEFCEKTLEELKIDDSNISFAKQLESLKERGNKSIEESKNKFNSLSEIHQKLEEADIVSKAEISIQQINVKDSEINNLVKKRISDLTNKIKQIDIEISKFESRVKEITLWQEDKKKYLSGVVNESLNISGIEIEISNCSTKIPNELKSIKENSKTTQEIGQKIIDTHHEKSEEIQKKIEDINKLNEEIEKETEEILKKLEELLEKKKSVEKNSVDFAKNIQTLNLFLENSILLLKEPISAQSVSDVEEIKKSVEKLEEDLKENEKLLEETKEIHKNISEQGANAEIYSDFTLEQINEKFENVKKLLEEKNSKINEEKEIQERNENVVKEFNEGSSEYFKWIEEETKEISKELEGELEDQLKKIKEIGEKIIKENVEKVNKLKEEYKKVEEYDITEKTENSLQEIGTADEQLKKTVSDRKDAIEKQILAKKSSGVSEAQIKEFMESFKYFDKQNKGKLSKLEFKAAVSSIGEDVEDSVLEAVFKKYDKDSDGNIDLNEFIEYMSEVSKQGEGYEDIEKAFKEVSGGSEEVSEDQLRSCMQKEEVDDLIKKMPKTSSGKYDFKGYLKNIYGKK